MKFKIYTIVIIGMIFLSGINLYTKGDENVGCFENKFQNTENISSESVLDSNKLNILPIGFNSYIEIEYDSSALEKPIHPLGGVRNVDLDGKYWTDMPDDFLGFLPFKIRNLLLFGSQLPYYSIYLSLENIPKWGVISISPPEIMFMIPDGNEIFEFTATMQISLY